MALHPFHDWHPSCGDLARTLAAIAREAGALNRAVFFKPDLNFKLSTPEEARDFLTERNFSAPEERVHQPSPAAERVGV